jgi:hypothetical protein
MLTSNVRDAQHSYAALLDHAALVREQRDSPRRGARVGSAAIGKVVARDDARLVGSLLGSVSIDVACRSQVRQLPAYLSHEDGDAGDTNVAGWDIEKAGFGGGNRVGRGYYNVKVKKRSRKEAVGGGSGEFVLSVGCSFCFC